MNIDPDRYDTEVAQACAVGPTEILAKIGSYSLSQGINLSEDDSIEHTCRISINASIEFPEKFKDHTLLVEIKGLQNVQLWDDIDPEHRCLGNLRWFGKTTFHISLNVSLEAVKNISTLLYRSDANEHLPRFLGVTAIGMESIEFQNNEIKKGLAVTEVHVLTKGSLDKSVYLEKDENYF